MYLALCVPHHWQRGEKNTRICTRCGRRQHFVGELTGWKRIK